MVDKLDCIRFGVKSTTRQYNAEDKWFEAVKGQSILFKEMVERYMESHAKSRDPHTIKRLLPAFGHLPLAGITTDLVSDYRRARISNLERVASSELR